MSSEYPLFKDGDPLALFCENKTPPVFDLKLRKKKKRDRQELEFVDMNDPLVLPAELPLLALKNKVILPGGVARINLAGNKEG